MMPHLRGYRATGSGVLAFLALGLLPGSVFAEVLAFRNDTGTPIVVQGACIVQGTVQRDRPHPLAPNESCRITLPGNKLITIYDPRMPNQILFKGNYPAGTEDLYFSVRLDPTRSKVIVERVKAPNAKK
jgi:hypothetical protein